MIEKLPEEFKGKVYRNNGLTKSNPRKWTQKEIDFVKQLHKKGCTLKEIAESTNRTLTSVAIKIKRLSKIENTYNSNHIDEKYEINRKFVEIIKPKTILDCYSGEISFYKKTNKEIVVSNDINKNIKADYNLDSLKLLCTLYPKKFDLIDLDPYGSAYDLFDLAIKMSNKGLAITLGELGHRRWKRLDYVSRYYGINNLDDFTTKNLISHIQMIGRRNKKILIPIFIKEWKNISRVWFKIEPMKTNKQ